MTLERPIREWNGLTIPEPGVYTLDEAHKRIGFQAQHMMVSPIRGEFATGSASILIAEDPLQSSVTASIATASVNTHNEERDTHLRSGDFLDVETFPHLTFRSTSVTYPESNEQIFAWARLRNSKLGRRGMVSDLPPAVATKPGRFVVHGDLTIRDVTRPIDLQLDFGGASRDPYGRDIFGFSATAEFEREDYGLVWNVLLESGGFLVGKRVRIEIAGEAIRD